MTPHRSLLRLLVGALSPITPKANIVLFDCLAKPEKVNWRFAAVTACSRKAAGELTGQAGFLFASLQNLKGGKAGTKACVCV